MSGFRPQYKSDCKKCGGTHSSAKPHPKGAITRTTGTLLTGRNLPNGGTNERASSFYGHIISRGISFVKRFFRFFRRLRKKFWGMSIPDDMQGRIWAKAPFPKKLYFRKSTKLKRLFIVKGYIILRVFLLEKLKSCCFSQISDLGVQFSVHFLFTP